MFPVKSVLLVSVFFASLAFAEEPLFEIRAVQRPDGVSYDIVTNSSEGVLLLVKDAWVYKIQNPGSGGSGFISHNGDFAFIPLMHSPAGEVMANTVWSSKIPGLNKFPYDKLTLMVEYFKVSDMGKVSKMSDIQRLAKREYVEMRFIPPLPVSSLDGVFGPETSVKDEAQDGGGPSASNYREN